MCSSDLTDSALVAELVARAWPEERSDGKELELALEQVLPKLQGGFSFVLMDDSHLIGARDPHGFWPLVLGRLDGGGWVFASESAAPPFPVIRLGEVAAVTAAQAGDNHGPNRSPSATPI